jgi:hypothetical protein
MQKPLGSREVPSWLLIIIGWALSLVGIYAAAYLDSSRLEGLIAAGPVFTVIGVWSIIRSARAKRRARQRTTAETDRRTDHEP